ncbi:unnamed protein product [Orchesella dallaii]|uniref:Uncharacterized protein n=1 Tax=Orchesella dallaii TaxID=48710 RepID=A0ABP1Q5S4_9HEXA
MPEIACQSLDLQLQRLGLQQHFGNDNLKQAGMKNFKEACLILGMPNTLENPPLSLTKSQPIVSTGISSVVGGGVGRFSARASIRSWGRSNLNGSSMMEIKESGIIPFLQQALAIR